MRPEILQALKHEAAKGNKFAQARLTLLSGREPLNKQTIENKEVRDKMPLSPAEEFKKKPTNYAEVVKQLREETPSEEFKRKYDL